LAGPLLLAEDREVRLLARVQRPAAALLSGLIDQDECAALIDLARPRRQHIVAGYRSSDEMFFRLAESPLVAVIERRIAALTSIPAENGEGLQLLHYPQCAQTTPHVDYLQPINDAHRASIARSGQRIATMFLYLNDVESRDVTTFPATGISTALRTP
jgi:prolyl 4-hydroxylase